MKLLATSDLHLTIAVPQKNMSRFGPHWDNHLQRIQDGWKKMVGPEDLVIVAGDVSWASSIEDARPDFDFIEALPGKKVLTVGNHDHYHQSATKSNAFFFENYKTIVSLIRNDYFPIGDTAICAVKGYFNETHPEFKEEYRKVYNRECQRLDSTLQLVPSTMEHVILVSHYPPVHPSYTSSTNKMVEIMKKHGVRTCCYGHLHQDAATLAVSGVRDGIEYFFVAGDSHNFEPQLIKVIE